MSADQRGAPVAVSTATRASSPAPTASPPGSTTSWLWDDDGGTAQVPRTAAVAGSTTRIDPASEPAYSRPSGPKVTAAVSARLHGVLGPGKPGDLTDQGAVGHPVDGDVAGVPAGHGDRRAVRADGDVAEPERGGDRPEDPPARGDLVHREGAAPLVVGDAEHLQVAALPVRRSGPGVLDHVAGVGAHADEGEPPGCPRRPPGRGSSTLPSSRSTIRRSRPSSATTADDVPGMTAPLRDRRAGRYW